MYDASSRKDVRAAEKAAKLLDQQRQEVITQIMQTIPGRAYICDQLESCHVFHTSFQVDALITAFSEGQRSIGLQVLGDLMRACPDQYILMMRERNERDAARSADDLSKRPNGTDAGGDLGEPSRSAEASGGDATSH